MFYCLFLSGFLLFLKSCSHSISTLLSLEFIALSIFLLLSTTHNSLINETYLGLFYLAVVVCEGALGLAIIVAYARVKGNELFKNMNTTLW